MEYVSFGEGEGDPSDSQQDNGLGQMSEKVQAMAQNIYVELETLVRAYGPESAQAITPILVRLLECLDEEIKHRRETQTELELAKADREQLLNHYERERELRRKAEEQNMSVEDEAELDKSVLRTKLEELEHKIKFLDSRAQTKDDLTRKDAETMDDMRNRYADLSKRHDEMLQKYMSTVEENRSLRTNTTYTSTPKETKSVRKIIKGDSTEVYNINIVPEKNALINMESQTGSNENNPNFHNVSIGDELREQERNQAVGSSISDSSSDIPEDVKELIAKTDVIQVENESFEGKSVSRTVTELEQENERLRETKNALNIVKDDLLKELEEISSRYALIKIELEKAKSDKDQVHKRVVTMESDLDKMKASVQSSEKSEEVEEGEDPTEKRKRFTRVEMARVLMERNQYKERLMELQEAVRWTEMLRASKFEQLEENKVVVPARKKEGGIYTFFSRLFGSGVEKGTGGPAGASGAGANRSPDSEEAKFPSNISPSNSTELSQLSKVAGFVQDRDNLDSKLSHSTFYNLT